MGFNTITKDFDSKEDALDWIINNQLGRRNLTEMQKSYLRGLQYKRERKKLGSNLPQNSLKVQNELLKNETVNNTAERLADQHKVSASTIKRDGQFVDAIDTLADNLGEDIKDKILNKEINISKAQIARVVEMSPEEQLELAVNDFKVNKNIKEDKPTLPEKKTKTCSTCGKELLLSEFYDGNNQCRLQDNLTSKTQTELAEALAEQHKVTSRIIYKDATIFYITEKGAYLSLD